MTRNDRIYLSPPDQSGFEEEYVLDALRSNWIAPLGPHVDAFEREVADIAATASAAAMVSGTAALHLALLLTGVEAGDEVLVSTLTFAGSVFPIRYVGAHPVFVDSERESWNLDPALVAEAVESRAKDGRAPAAVVVVHLYGQTADVEPILETCERFGVAVIEDAAEALGATYRGTPAGGLAPLGLFSFNGNKILTTSGGGMLLSDDPALMERARYLASQARQPAHHYEHAEIGYNYRMSNLLAAVGRAQLRNLDQRLAARRSNYVFYEEALGDVPGVEFMPEAEWGVHSRWLTTLTLGPDAPETDPEVIRQELESLDIETRPLWKPMHLQPVFSECERVGGGVAEDLFRRGLCLPSGSGMTEAERQRVADALRGALSG